MFAAYNNNSECVKLLLENDKIDASIKALNDYTALMVAKSYKSKDCINILST
jgi:ankyrin repeat protein